MNFVFIKLKVILSSCVHLLKSTYETYLFIWVFLWIKHKPEHIHLTTFNFIFHLTVWSMRFFHLSRKWTLMRQVCQVNGRWNKLKGVLHLWTSHRLILTCFPITHLCLLYPTSCLKWDLFLETDLDVCRGIRSFHCPKFTSEGECVLNTFFSPIGITDFHLRKRRWEVWSKARNIIAKYFYKIKNEHIMHRNSIVL